MCWPTRNFGAPCSRRAPRPERSDRADAAHQPRHPTSLDADLSTDGNSLGSAPTRCPHAGPAHHNDAHLARRPGRTRDAPWAHLWQEGHGDTWRADTEYIAQREHAAGNPHQQGGTARA